MKGFKSRSDRITFAVCAALCLPMAAFATDGYFPHGYGMKSLGEGGASIARTDDAYGGANNPATMVFAGGRLDLGLSWFSPDRTASRSGSTLPSGYGNLDGTVTSGSKSFFIPELGYNRMMSDSMSLGLTVYGNGGMNTDYPQGSFACPTRTGPAPANMLCGAGSLGIDLTQLIVAPTFSMKLAPEHSLGASVLITEQRFKATGLQAFTGSVPIAPGSSVVAPISTSPGNVTDNGYAYSHGFGLRIGYLWKPSDVLSVGATYTTQTSMSKFSKYQGLFADQGSFNLPSNYGVGVRFKPASDWTIALDVQRIDYADVSSVSNQSMVPAQLGAAGGPGFGWSNITVEKLGFDYQATRDLVLRAGYNHSTNPISSQNVTFNILAPGVIQDHFTLGSTWQIAGTHSEITVAGAYMPSKSVTGSSYLNGMFSLQGMPPGAGGTETVKMSEKELGIAWATRF
jgi:long-chain fatty acid transport protein